MNKPKAVPVHMGPGPDVVDPNDSIIASVMRYIGIIVKAFVLGVAAFLFITTLFGWGITTVMGQEATYPAHLGEQDHRLVTEQPSYGTPHHRAEYMEWVYQDNIGLRASCDSMNAHFRWMLQNIAEFIVKYPSEALTLRPAIIAIHTNWCRS